MDEAENGQLAVEKAMPVGMTLFSWTSKCRLWMDSQQPEFFVRKVLKFPVIALTANAMKGFEAQCLEAGYSGYLSKPINIDQFMELMAQLLGGRKVKRDAGSDSTAGDFSGCST